MRALIYYTAGAIDRAKRSIDDLDKQRQQKLADFLIPIVKSWCTDTGCSVTSTALQIHGGMGYIEQTGAAQHFRDARITPIYEGTNGIQGIDLVGRKLARDAGAAARTLIQEMAATASGLETEQADEIRRLAPALQSGVESLITATDWLVKTWPQDRRVALAAASPYLSLLGLVAGGWLLAKSAAAAHRRQAAAPGDASFLGAKKATAAFYFTNLLPLAAGLSAAVTGGGASALVLADDQF
jgi:hypothetical protein